jgi:uncharacterized membrane protein
VEIALLKFVHVLAFVFWLGTDLAVWYIGFYAVNRKLSAETRVTVIRLLFALDMAPRICMTLMLALGIHLSYRIGYLLVSPWVIYATYLICLAWMSLVLYLHYGEKTRMQRMLRRLVDLCCNFLVRTQRGECRFHRLETADFCHHHCLQPDGTNEAQTLWSGLSQPVGR